MVDFSQLIAPQRLPAPGCSWQAGGAVMLAAPSFLRRAAFTPEYCRVWRAGALLQWAPYRPRLNTIRACVCAAGAAGAHEGSGRPGGGGAAVGRQHGGQPRRGGAYRGGGQRGAAAAGAAAACRRRCAAVAPPSQQPGAGAGAPPPLVPSALLQRESHIPLITELRLAIEVHLLYDLVATLESDEQFRIFDCAKTTYDTRHTMPLLFYFEQAATHFLAGRELGACGNSR